MQRWLCGPFIDQGGAWSCGWGKYGQLGWRRTATPLHAKDVGALQQRELHEQGVQEALRSTGCIVAQADQVHFSNVRMASQGPMGGWEGVVCGLWSSYLWTTEEATRVDG